MTPEQSDKKSEYVREAKEVLRQMGLEEKDLNSTAETFAAQKFRHLHQTPHTSPREIERMRLWCAVYLRELADDQYPEVAANHADIATEEFDERFNG